MSIHEFLGAKFGVFFQTRYRLKLLLAYGLMLAKMKNICQKFKNFKFHNSLNNFDRDHPHEYA